MSICSFTLAKLQKTVWEKKGVISDKFNTDTSFSNLQKYNTICEFTLNCKKNVKKSCIVVKRKEKLHASCGCQIKQKMRKWNHTK